MNKEQFCDYCVMITLLVATGIFTAFSFAVFAFVKLAFTKAVIMSIMFFACGMLFTWVWDIFDRE